MAGAIPLNEKSDFEYARSRAMGYARKKLGLEPTDAEEVVDQALIRALERKTAFTAQSGVPFLAWLTRVVVNAVIDEHRHRGRVERLRDLACESLAPSSYPTPEMALIDKEAERNRLTLIEALPRDLAHVLDAMLEQREGHIMPKAMMRLGLRKDDVLSGRNERRAVGSDRAAGGEEET